MSSGKPSTPRRPARQAADEDIVRRYIRSVIGAPVRERDGAEGEERFIAVAGRWAKRVGVDRVTLISLGVDTSVLDRAGVTTVPSRERLRRHWQPAPFSVADLARRSGIPVSTVRRAVTADEEAGLLRRAGREGRRFLWEGD